MTVGAVELPSGLVTFVFTDIEGSTRLFHRLGDRYVEMLEQHRSLLREACTRNGGAPISEDGDSSFMAFPSPAQGLRACAEAQAAMSKADWPDRVEPRVRMGLHTGMAWPHRGDYIAIAVHQAARVMAAANGGQVIASQFTVEAADSLDRSGLQSLGRYRVRDFEEPVELYQISAAGSPADFPAPRALPADRHNIVRPATETIGRDDTITAVVERIRAGRCLTLIGPGGVGKTRVAVDVGVHIAPEWSDGVWFVDLAPITDGGQVVPALAEAIGASRGPDGDRWADVIGQLRDRRAVVILDNGEHMLPTCRELIPALLAECQGVGVLTTSREPVRIPGETLWPVKPLDTPGDDASAAAVGSSPSVRLFVERGAEVRPGFALDADSGPIVAEICRHLDGIPLFIELAAANLAVQSGAEILGGLEDRFRSLEARNPDTPQRHRTVENVVGWSFRLLGETEQQAFLRLSVFGTSFTLQAALAAVAETTGDGDSPQVVWSLVDRSLLSADLTASDTRYRMLEPVRRYARTLLYESGETAGVAENVAGFFLDSIGPWRAEDARWRGEVGAEIRNLQALVPMLSPGSQELAQQVAITIGRFHDTSHSFREGIEELTRYADMLTEPTATRSSLLATLAYLHLRTGDSEAAEELVGTAIELREEHGAPEWDEVGVERNLGEIARRRGAFDEAARIASEALKRPLGDRGRSRMLNLLGTSLAALGDFDTAYDACATELELNEKLGYEENIAASHGNLAEVAMRRGDLASAARHQLACLELASAQGLAPMMAFSMLVAARIAGSRREWATAVQLQTRAEAILSDVGLALYEDDRAEIDQLKADAQEALGAAGFIDSIAAGSSLPITEAVHLTQSVLR